MKNILSILFFAFVFVFAANGAVLVKDGKAAACIVVKANAPVYEKFAAQELQNYIRKITGVELEISTAPVKGLLPVRIGLESAFGELPGPLKQEVGKIDGAGFVIGSSTSSLDMVSKTSHGVLNGVYYLIRKYGGVRFFHPETPEYIPQSDGFLVPDGIILKNPAFQNPDIPANGVWTPPYRMRAILREGLDFTGKPSFLLRENKRFSEQCSAAEELGLYDETNIGGHMMTDLLVGFNPPGGLVKATEVLFREHPEYFGLVHGKRVLSGNDLRGKETVSQPCTSNPEVLKRMAENLKKWIAPYKNRKLVIFFYNDDHEQWCECPACTALDDPSAGIEGKRSDRWWAFINYMSRALLTDEHPNLYMRIGIYQNYRDVPKKTRIVPHERLFVNLCPHGRCYLHSLDDAQCKYNPKYLAICESFWKLGIRSDIYEYLEVLPGASAYLPIERAYFKDMKKYYANGVTGMKFYVIAGPHPYGKSDYYETFYAKNHWESLWRAAYMLGYFNWDPDCDYESVWEDVNSKYYGKAWKSMREYLLTLEKAMSDANVHASYGGSPSTIFGKAYDLPGVAAKAKSLLEKALAEAETDPVVLKRVAKDAELFRMNFAESSFSNFGDSSSAVRVEKNSGKITIDGKLDEPDWIKARGIDDFYTNRQEITVGQFKSEKAVPPTVLKAVYDRDSLYLGVQCFKANGRTADAGKDFKGFPWQSSHLEFFIMTPTLAQTGKYYHIGFTRDGRIYNALTSDMTTCDSSDRLDFEYKITDAADSWTAEIRIDVRKLGSIQDGALWKFNAARTAVGPDGKNVNASFAGRGGNFHTLSHFKLFSFGSDGPLLLNGSFETLTDKLVTKESGKDWTFRSKEIPADWIFHSNASSAEVRTDSPAEGKLYLRIGEENKKQGYPILYQTLRNTDPSIHDFLLKMKIRGKGIVEPYIYVMRQGKCEFGKKAFRAVPDRWTEVSYPIRADVPGVKKFFILIHTGYVDLDDISLEPVKNP